MFCLCGSNIPLLHLVVAFTLSSAVCFRYNQTYVIGSAEPVSMALFVFPDIGNHNLAICVSCCKEKNPYNIFYFIQTWK